MHKAAILCHSTSIEPTIIIEASQNSGLHSSINSPSCMVSLSKFHSAAPLYSLSLVSMLYCGIDSMHIAWDTSASVGYGDFLSQKWSQWQILLKLITRELSISRFPLKFQVFWSWGFERFLLLILYHPELLDAGFPFISPMSACLPPSVTRQIGITIGDLFNSFQPLALFSFLSIKGLWSLDIMLVMMPTAQISALYVYTHF
jgi:hypothetical protein